MAKEDISNRTVLVLALLVVLVVASSTWMVLNKLNGINPDASSEQAVNLQQSAPSSAEPQGGRVTIAVLPPEEE